MEGSLESKFLLKVVWLEEKIGIAVDQVIGKGTSPLTVYFFWPDQETESSPKGDAWHRLKDELDAKHWIPQEERDEVLTQATDVINFWGDLRSQNKSVTIAEAQEQFPIVIFTGSK